MTAEATEMIYSGIHHAAFATRNMGMTVRYWRDLLRMRLVHTLGRPGYRQYFFAVSDTTLLSFFEWPEVEKGLPHRHGEPVKGAFTFDHLAIGVVDLEQLGWIANRLIAARFPVSDVINHGFHLSIYSHDPNGIPLEFSCPVAGVDIRQTPRLRDLSPPPETAPGSEPQPGWWPEPDHDDDNEALIPIDGEGSEWF